MSCKIVFDLCDDLKGDYWYKSETWGGPIGLRDMTYLMPLLFLLHVR